MMDLHSREPMPSGQKKSTKIWFKERSWKLEATGLLTKNAFAFLVGEIKLVVAGCVTCSQATYPTSQVEPTGKNLNTDSVTKMSSKGVWIKGFPSARFSRYLTVTQVCSK
jgi:hypothetical protein